MASHNLDAIWILQFNTVFLFPINKNILYMMRLKQLFES